MPTALQTAGPNGARRDTVLVVDDSPDIRLLMRITLGKKYEVLEADSGMQGIELIQLYQPPLILLDIMMPGAIDGLQVLDFVKPFSPRDVVVWVESKLQ